ncbi:MAG: SCP2 sterol-binding domain-containing protein [Chloroflexi bacterium]|nr:SCP2 sterol-binding domain-containing protein [Chloroflexota bacterium]
MSEIKYLSSAWIAEVDKYLHSENFPAQDESITISLNIVHQKCPDRKTKVLFCRIEKGKFSGLSLFEQISTESEFTITGEYATFVKIMRSEISGGSALMKGDLVFQGNLMRTLDLISIIDQVHKLIAQVPCAY